MNKNRRKFVLHKAHYFLWKIKCWMCYISSVATNRPTKVVKYNRLLRSVSLFDWPPTQRRLCMWERQPSLQRTVILFSLDWLCELWHINELCWTGSEITFTYLSHTFVREFHELSEQSGWWEKKMPSADKITILFSSTRVSLSIQIHNSWNKRERKNRQITSKNSHSNLNIFNIWSCGFHLLPLYLIEWLTSRIPKVVWGHQHNGEQVMNWPNSF